ncbi:MAG TPA: helix-turn-helix domain-containing protein [Thermoanaerobaculia bacterium]|nr:helix-turn-helix domain-containing protein [Thermoanaerobaculia bacterium]
MARESLTLGKRDARFLAIKRALAESLRERRRRKRFSQLELAGLIGTSQSRIARMEAADPAVSLDLLVRSLLALGATRRDIARAIASAKRAA